MTKTLAQNAAKWSELASDSVALMIEANCVIWLRSMRFMQGGPDVEREIHRMIGEKVAANLEIGAEMILSGPRSPEYHAANALRHYRRKVNANRKRLAGRSA